MQRAPGTSVKVRTIQEDAGTVDDPGIGTILIAEYPQLGGGGVVLKDVGRQRSSNRLQIRGVVGPVEFCAQ